MDNGLSYQDMLNRLGLPEPAELVHGQRRIHQAMRRLSDAHHIVLVLRYFHGYTPADVATLLQAPLKTIQTWQIGGLRELRVLM